MSDNIRAYRLIEYEGPREWVEQTLGLSIIGSMHMPERRITAAVVDLGGEGYLGQALEEARRTEYVPKRTPRWNAVAEQSGNYLFVLSDVGNYKFPPSMLDAASKAYINYCSRNQPLPPFGLAPPSWLRKDPK